MTAPKGYENKASLRAEYAPLIADYIARHGMVTVYSEDGSEHSEYSPLDAPATQAWEY
jgi:hypothetical protein